MSHFEEEAVVLVATWWPLLSGYLLFTVEITAPCFGDERVLSLFFYLPQI